MARPFVKSTAALGGAGGGSACALPPPRCLHCAQPLPVGAEGAFCCPGCATVYDALREEGLGRYYRLRDRAGVPPLIRHTQTTWLEPMARALSASPHAQRLVFDVQGMHCTACVWLLERVFERQAGAERVTVNPSIGQITLWVSPHFDLLEFARSVARFGYQLGPASKRSDARTDDLLLRLGVCSALALNSMVLSAAMYFGLSEGPLRLLFQQINFALGAVSVAVGGSVFIRAAWRSARRGLTHLDQPIALGIVLAFVGSAWAQWSAVDAVYFDSLCVFVALMVAGRWLQERVLQRNRQLLLQDDGVDRLVARRLVGGQVRWVRCGELRAGDTLLLAPGDLVPANTRLLDERAQLSLDWVDGEPTPRAFGRGAQLPAGAFNAGDRALRVRLLGDFDSSPLRTLLGAPRTARDAQSGAFWRRLAAWYVWAVALLASVAGAAWWLSAGPSQGLSVAVAVLVVTCPCAFGFATPLAYELTLSRLRRLGLFVRSGDLLDRALRVRQVVFDKTGTLTTGRLDLVDEDALARLSEHQRSCLFQLSARSSHPKSATLSAALARAGARLGDDVDAQEITGRGVQARVDGALHRLGAARWACPGHPEGEGSDLWYAVDGHPVLALRTREQPRPDAAQELRALSRAGYALWMLTGDEPRRATTLANDVGLPAARVVAEQRPEDKAAWLRAHGADTTLMIGDGVNDAPAMRTALCGGTPAVDRPFMPARTDFYFVTPGLAPIRELLRAAHQLRRVVRGNLALAVAYNALAVGVAAAGWMRPWLAAVLMPLSSLSVISLTLSRLSTGGRAWRS